MPGLFSAPRSDYPLDPKYGARRGESLVTVVDAGGSPVPNAEVTVAQTNHQFLFGNIGFELIDWINGYRHDDDGGGVAPLRHLEIGETPLGRDTSNAPDGGLTQSEYDEVLAQRWLALFNQATLPFYWGRFEPVEGQPRTAELKRAAEWFRDRNVVLKGHPLVWHTVQPDWLLEKPLSEVEHLLRRRIQREVTDFAGLIDTWDAINEVVIMPVFENGDNAITPLSRVLGRIGMVRRAFEDARKANPHVTLILNDFDMSTAYEALLEGVLEAGIKIDKLGLQSHQQQGFWGLEKTERVLNRFARYNIPIHFTETTLVSGDLMPPEIVDLNDYQVTEWPTTPEGEERQADELELWYRTLTSHPLVEAITYWGMGDRGMWLNAPGGLLRLDGTPKPGYDRLMSLIKGEWWLAPTKMRTDANGQVTVSGWKGTYEVTAPDGTVTPVTVA